MEWVQAVLGMVQSPSGILVSAALLDFALGDPWGWPHPVRGMGWAIQGYSQWAWRQFKSPLLLRWAGGLLAIGLVGGSALLAWAVISEAYRIWMPLGWVLEVVLLASCFAGRSLRAAAEEVLQALKTKPLVEARTALSGYVGRDTTDLSEAEVLRAVLETVAENTTDGVMAPLFYGLLGLALPSIGPVPLAIAYKAASTLDSMVGYRQDPYTHLGWFSAHLDDCLTWLPCRLNVFTLGGLSGKLQTVLRLCRRDAMKDPSPNSGWSECAYAAILEVQLGGFNTYGGVLKLKPLLGKPYRPITPERIALALRLMRNSFVTWVVFAIALRFLWTPP
ncbi:MAG: adenosylcobinamide-phosphate synthase CbiB [Thermosynechococcaceae cyanobacterium]